MNDRNFINALFENYSEEVDSVSNEVLTNEDFGEEQLSSEEDDSVLDEILTNEDFVEEQLSSEEFDSVSNEVFTNEDFFEEPLSSEEGDSVLNEVLTNEGFVEEQLSIVKPLESPPSAVVCIDSEFTDTYFVSLQIYIKDLEEKIFVVNSKLFDIFPEKADLLEGLKEEFESNKRYCTRVLYMDLDDKSNNNLNDILLEVYKEHQLGFPKYITLLLYFAIRDLYACFGYNNLLETLLKGRKQKSLRSNRIYFKRNLKGTLYSSLGGKYKIFDLYGIVDSSSLKNVADSVGITMSNKTLLDAYKARMSDPLLSDDFSLRATFLRYSMADAIILYYIWSQRIRQHNSLLKYTLNYPKKYLFNKHSFPSTVGALISKTFHNFLFIQAEKEVTLPEFKYAICKVGYLDVTHKQYQKKHLDDRYDVYINRDSDGKLIEKHCTPTVYSYDAINLTSIPSLLTKSKSNMTALLSLVAGGRCTNERYRENKFSNLLDLDLSSCYGSALKDLVYPIGRPYIYATCINERGMTLKAFLKQHKKELIPGLYKIVVHGDLTFEQDLIYSKILSKGHNTKLYSESDTWFFEEEELNTDHVLLKKQIVNGIITEDVLKVIQNVASNQEKSELFNLEVKAAAYWKKSHRVESIKEWCEIIKNSQEDSEQLYYWVGVPVGNYINPLLEKRKKVKKQMKAERNINKKNLLNGSQTSLKLSINTLYGCLASKYFRIGNAVLADNITARPRVNIWLAVKALRGIQVITDGFLYEPDNISVLRDDLPYFRMPSLHAFADYYRMIDSRYIKQGSLFNKSWSEIFKDEKSIQNIDFTVLNKDAQKYVNDFWKRCNLSVDLEFEHKESNVSYSAATAGKAHYALKTVYNQNVYKIRGSREYFQDKRHPMYSYLDAINNNLSIFPKDMYVYNGTILQINEWAKLYAKDQNYPHRPGDMVIMPPKKLAFTLNFVPTKNLKKHESMKRRTNKQNALPYYEEHNIENPYDMINHMADKYYDKIVKKRRPRKRGPKAKRGRKKKKK